MTKQGVSIMGIALARVEITEKFLKKVRSI